MLPRQYKVSFYFKVRVEPRMESNNIQMKDQ